MAGGFYTATPVGNGSLVVNGQIVPVPMMNQFFPPLASAPFYKGSGQPPPTVPLNYMPNASAMNSAAGQQAADNPFSFVQSPLIIAVAALIIGLLGLRYIHWR